MTFFSPRNRIIPSDETEVSLEVRKWPRGCGGEEQRIRFLEHVELKVNLNYTLRGDLVMDLVSPDGTVSHMTHYRLIDSAAKFTDLTNWVVMTLHLWGENPEGKWRLKLRNSQTQHKNTGKNLNNRDLKIFSIFFHMPPESADNLRHGFVGLLSYTFRIITFSNALIIDGLRQRKITSATAFGNVIQHLHKLSKLSPSFSPEVCICLRSCIKHSH